MSLQIPRGDRAVSPRNLRISPRGGLPPPAGSSIDARYSYESGESRIRSFTTIANDIKGYLQRKNPRAVTTQRWIKQWYSVSGDLLSFYNSKEDEENGKAPIGSIELDGATLGKPKEDKAFQLTTPKKDLVLFTSTEAELFQWMEALNAIIGALKRRQAGLLEQHRDRQRLVELESRFEELLVVDLSDTVETVLAAYGEARNIKEKESLSSVTSPRSLQAKEQLLSPRANLSRSPLRPLALSGGNTATPAQLEESLSSDDLSLVISQMASLRAAPIPRLYYNWMFAHNRVVVWFARLVKFEVQEVPLTHRRQYLVARGIESPDWLSLPMLEYFQIDAQQQAQPQQQQKLPSWTVCEGHAILRYICNAHAPASLWYPSQLAVRTLVDEYLDWHLSVFRRAVHGLWQLTLNQALRSGERDTAEQPMQRVRTLINQALETLDQRLSTKEFIATDEDPTIADLVADAEVQSLAVMGWDLSAYSQIVRWRETMQLLDHWAAVNKMFVDFIAWLRGSDAIVS